jgi:hypothetical protein
MVRREENPRLPKMALPPSQLSSQETGRVEDYLNDKFQTISDLENLDSLLDNLREQHELQQKQVRTLPF